MRDWLNNDRQGLGNRRKEGYEMMERSNCKDPGSGRTQNSDKVGLQGDLPVNEWSVLIALGNRGSGTVR